MAATVQNRRFHNEPQVSLVRAPGHARLRLVPLAALEVQDLQSWDELGERAATQSVYAQPWFMQHSLAQCDPAGSALLAILEDDSGWTGALPLVRVSKIGRAPLRGWQAWSHPNRFVGTPLVREGAMHGFWRGLLAGLSETSRHELALFLPDMATDDPVFRALIDVCAEDQRVLALDGPYARPLLRPDRAPAVSPKQQRRTKSLLRKLANDIGPPEFRLIRDPGEISARVETFLELEKSGWKGASGSALACSQQNRAMFTSIVQAGAMRGRCEMAELSIRGEVLALSTQLIGNGRAYGFKAAYGESFAAYAPGLLLLDWLMQVHLEDQSALPLDSCAAPDQQPVSRLWHDRCELTDCRVAVGGELRRGMLRALLGSEAAYAALKRMLPGPASPLEP